MNQKLQYALEIIYKDAIEIPPHLMEVYRVIGLYAPDSRVFHPKRGLGTITKVKNSNQVWIKWDKFKNSNNATNYSYAYTRLLTPTKYILQKEKYTK